MSIGKSDKHQNVSFKTKIIAGFILSLAITIIVFIATEHNIIFEEPDKFIFDWKVSLFSSKIKSQRSDITLVYIDDTSLSGYPYKSPIDRGLVSKVIREINDAQPKALGIDLIFDRPTEDKRDDELIKALDSVSIPIIIAGTSTNESGVTHHSINWQEEYLGKINKIIASPFLGEESSATSLGDAVVRNFEEYEHGSGEKPFSLALAEQIKEVSYPSGRLIDWILPSQNGTEVFQTFVIPSHRRISFSKIEEPLLSPMIQAKLKNKIVILGGSVSGSDWHRVPMTVSTGLEVPGAYIHAQMLAQLLDGRTIEKAPIYFSIIMVFVTALLLYLALETVGEKHPEIIFEFLIIFCAIIFGTIMFSFYRLNFPSAELALVWILVALSAKYTTRIASIIFNRVNQMEINK